MSKSKTIWVAALAVTSLLAANSQAAPRPQADKRGPGLYMTFQTDKGDIACKLYEKEAPITVRTMVGLAIGKISYKDPATGQTMKKKFFDGLTFHRVIPMFMIQGGDPLGNGTGMPEGPGFPYKNETSPSLKFDGPGRLAMANAGPGTNGSQFFITEVPYPSLDGHYSIFGQCDDASVAVVKAIARVPRDSSDRPLTPVVLQKVTIVPEGQPLPPAPAVAAPQQ